MDGVHANRYRTSGAWFGASRCALFVAMAAGAWTSSALAQTTPSAAPSDPNSSQAQPQTGLQDIVVTARRVSERLQDVPISVTAIGGLAARDARIASAQDLKGTVPNLNVQKSSVPGSGLLQVRGIELGSIPFTGADTRIGIYIDGVYLGRTTGNSSPLADIDRIEVLKGPQGTLFGKNETGGAINFITKVPTGEFGGTAEAGTGNDGRQHYRFTINTPKVGDFSARVTYVRERDTGDIRNLTSGTTYGPYVNTAVGFNSSPSKNPSRFGATFSDSVFAAVRYASGPLTIDYKFDYTRLKDSSAAYEALGFPGSFVGCIGAALRYGTPISCGPIAAAVGLNTPIPATSAAANSINPAITMSRRSATAQDMAGYAKVEHWGQSLTAQYVVNDALTFKNIFGYRHLDSHNQVDSDTFALYGLNDVFNAVGTRPALPAGGVTMLCGACSEGGLKQHEFSDEFQIIGKPAHWIEYIAGAYYFNEHPSQTYYFSANVAPFFTPYGFGVPPIPANSAVSIGNNTFDNGDNSRVNSISRALYAHVTTHFENLDIAVGGRYTQDRKTSVIGDVLASRTCQAGSAVNPDGTCVLPVPTRLKTANNKFTYDASATYKFTPDVNVYVRYATAYLAGGAVRNVAFAPETTKAIEGGLKSEWFNRRLRFNVAGFYQNSKNAQITTNLPPYGSLVLQNRGSLKTSGVEAELQLLVARGLTLGANGAYTHQKFSIPQRQNVPDWTAQLSAQYDSAPIWDGAHIQVKLDGNYRAHYYSINFPLTDAASGNTDGTALPANVWAGYSSQTAYLEALDKAARNGGYWLANARVSLADIAIGGTKGRVSGFVQNLFDNKGVVQGQNLGLVVGAVFEQERRYGIDFTIDF